MGVAPATRMGRNLLVVGGTGFIGRNVCARAIADNMIVTSISKHKPSAADVIDGVDYHCCDLEAPDPFSGLPQNRFDYVVASGGYVDHSPFSKGGTSVLNVHFLAIRKLVAFLDRGSLRRLVHIGSSDEYGDAPSPLSENLRESPFSAYSHAKVATTQLLQAMTRSENLPAVTCRLFLPYGPGQNMERFIPQIISGCLKDEKIRTTFGEQIRDFCYIDDVIDGIFKALDTPSIDGAVFNLASGVPVSVRSVVEKIVSLAGGGQPDFGARAYRDGESMSLFADVSYAKERLGWHARIDLEEGLSRTILGVKASASSNR